MFYSQFILAKKGPLGTIWIAAHLERKLRKNQVADTDIGVSVDSILFPEAPIALRLSSHLLLGVVRIYSKKVNYLFDDCSEALLKIKQAFRSTAVDLPPEASTAPYHSITLPETFDLDDFELPDHDIFHGNYVDQHISSKEQITLQDNMEGMAFSTSQFGLDERFGDGDTSALDLDEELHMDKEEIAGHADVTLISDAGPQSSAHPSVSFKQDGNQEAVTANSDTMLAAESANHFDDFDGDADPVEPCTPGLLEEHNLSTIQENSACDDHLDLDTHDVTEPQEKDNLENTSFRSDSCCEHKGVVDFRFIDVNSESLSVDQEMNQSVLADQVRDIPLVKELSSTTVALSNGPDREEDSHNVIATVEGRDSHFVGEVDRVCIEPADGLKENSLNGSAKSFPDGISENGHAFIEAKLSNYVGLTESVDVPCDLSIISELITNSPNKHNLDKVDTLFHHNNVTCTDFQLLRPCSTVSNQHDVMTHKGDISSGPDVTVLGSTETNGKEEHAVAPGASVFLQGDQNLATDCSEQILKATYIPEPASCSDLGPSSCQSIDQAKSVVSGDIHVENINGFMSSDLPSTEKMLSVPEGHPDILPDFPLENTPDQGVLVGDNRHDSPTGKKRSFTESSLTTQSPNFYDALVLSVEKTAAKSIPNDDDLLSSILVGRKSSILKVKPTPPQETSMKRRRYTPRTSACKRKVLMDDNMVLHGDTIRQQLVNTEDIRRLRKKAPCTRTEISMLQKQFWEDELFSESIFSGITMELASLQNQSFDLSKIRVCQNENVTLLEASCNLDIDARPSVVEESEKAANIVPVSTGDTCEAHPNIDPVSTGDTRVAHPCGVEAPIPKDNYESENRSTHIDGSVEPMHPAGGRAEDRNLEPDISTEAIPMEIECQNIAQTDVQFAGVIEVESSLDPAGSSLHIVSFDKTNETEASLLIDKVGVPPDENLDFPRDEMEASMNRSVDRDIDAEFKNCSVSVESVAKEELERIDGASDINEVTGCLENNHMKDDIEETRINDPVVVNEGEFLISESNCDDKKLLSTSVYDEELTAGTSFSTEVDVRWNDISSVNEEIPGQQEALQQAPTNVEVSSIDCEGREGFDYFAAGHDTDFLNVDDDEEIDEAFDDITPNTKETSYSDNSGWSIRTRAVARYLQTLFDKEAERGKKVIPMDNLLNGKTRKEASRMFFETLVLKTKDYIHVEQIAPFGNINIFPQAKLMKSDF